MQIDFSGYEFSAQPWYDDNFTMGFHRCGEFSIREADFLTHYGRLLKRLCSGEMPPATAEQARLLQVATGELPAETFPERVWCKYLKVVSRNGYAPSSISRVADAADNDEDS
ncbi:DUF413 domain-containing protein [Biformimicrobium ophioploci]|uniref:Macrodomain Ori protein n=1 Tax=Biformimicrobium ophioploci TaxID=3036711 RepID=A0ABQ6LVW5_9GAMM|nr:DUF413 domain-containing protein [Microbulbifer sp. NKW57]GMG86172.1 hypothetical protein MNKW57_04930 [Microbulbifer sp. NKW57]